LKNLRIHFLFLLVSGASSGWLLVNSRFGSGTTPDSVTYIGAARALLAGQGFSFSTAPITNFPPLFPVALSVVGLLGLDPLEGAFFLNVILFSVNIYLAGLLVYRSTGQAAAGLIAAALTLSAPAVLTVHSMVWSEPLFLSLVLLTALGIAGYTERPSCLSLLLPISAASLAPLCRYAGVSVIMAAAVAVAVKNFKHGAVLAVTGGAAILGWLMRNYFRAGDFTDRTWIFHLPSADQLTEASGTLVEALGGLTLAGFFTMLAVFTLLSGRQRVSERKVNVTFLIAFALSYVVVIAISLFYVDVYVPLDRRVLSPLYLALSLSAVILIAAYARSGALRFAWGGLLVLLLAANSWTATEWLNRLSREGFGYSNVYWRESPTIKFLKASESKLIYSNAPDPIYLLAGKAVAAIPNNLDPRSRLANPDYASQISRIKHGGGLIVYFRSVTWRWYLPSEEQLREELGLSLLAETGDGAVYRIP
jgi:hypothetical protein